MRAPDGSRWLSVGDAAREQRVRESTIRVWVHRGKVRAHTVLGKVYVCTDDVADAELEWRGRDTPAR